MMSTPAGHLALGGAEWQVDLFVLAMLLAGVAAYALAIEAAWRGGRRSILARRHIVSFLAGTAVVALALLSPIAGAAATSLSSHMLQHVLLVGLAAPLMAYGLPLARMPALARRFTGIGSTARWEKWRRRLPTLAVAAVIAVVLHTLAVWAWHLPVAYEAALGSPLVHVAEHAAMVGTATLFWWVVFGFGATTRPSLAPILGISFVAAQGALLGALMAFAPAPWYGEYAAAATRAGISPIADQQLAGLLMWGYGGIAAFIIGILLVIGWLGRMERYPASVEPVARIEPPGVA